MRVIAYNSVFTDTVSSCRQKGIKPILSSNFRMLPNNKSTFFNPLKSSFGYSINAGILFFVKRKNFVNVSMGLINDYYNASYNEFVIHQFKIDVTYRPQYISLPNVSFHFLVLEKLNKKAYIGIGCNRDILYRHWFKSIYNDGYNFKTNYLNEKFDLKKNWLKIYDGAFAYSYINLPITYEHTFKSFKILPTLEYKFNVIGALYKGLLFNGHHYWSFGFAIRK
jgi:hypothetical protein